MLSFFQSKPLVDESTHSWMIDTYKWILNEFNRDYFFNETQLIKPTNDFFPGKVGSIEEFASIILTKISEYAGVQHWPFIVKEEQQTCAVQPPKLSFKNGLRGNGSDLVPNYTSNNQIQLVFRGQQINQPQHLIASLSHQIAQYLALHTSTLPPGDNEYWVQATELLATAFGFGIMQANSSYTFKGGCSSCFNPNAVRQSSLTEPDNIYALAIFCQLKDIDKAEVLPHLKSHLRPLFKRALKQLSNHQQELAALKPSKLLLENQ